MTSNPELIVFDFDGTLADSALWVAGVFNEVADRFGFRALDTEELQALRGHDNREIIRHLGVPLWKMPLIAHHMRKRVAADTASIPLFAGVDRLLHRLHRADKKIAIVSSNSEANIRKILGNDNAKSIAYFGCGAGLFGKARLLRAAMKYSRVHPHATLCVGDETRDIEAARSVGAIAAAVTWGYATPAVLRSFAPDVVFETLDEIAEYCV